MSAPNEQKVTDFVFFPSSFCRKCTWEQGLPHQNTTAPGSINQVFYTFLFHLYAGSNNSNNIKQRPILKKRVVLDQSYTLGCTKEGNNFILEQKISNCEILYQFLLKLNNGCRWHYDKNKQNF